MNKNWAFETKQLHVGQEGTGCDSRAVPIYQTASYVFESAQYASDIFELKRAGNIYGRLTNSTQDVFEKRMAALEGGIGALAFASGMAAITCALQNLAKAGDHIVAAKTIYGGTYNLLSHTFAAYGIKTTFAEPKISKFEKAIQPNTKAILVETFGNPNSNMVDIEALAQLAHKNKIPLIVDNTFATPFLFRPIEYGADIVVHSATKFIGGQGAVLGGIIIDSGNFDWEASGKFESICMPNESYHGTSFTKSFGKAAYIVKARATLLRDTGAAISPFSAFMFLQGLETLSLRVERHVENTKKVLDFLKKHPKVENINHPSLCAENKKLYKKYFPNGAASIFTFEIKGGKKEAWKFIDKLQIFLNSANVADTKSLVIHPATTTHSQLNTQELKEQGIKPNTIRLSIGIENINDIISDLQQALA